MLAMKQAREVLIIGTSLLGGAMAGFSAAKLGGLADIPYGLGLSAGFALLGMLIQFATNRRKDDDEEEEYEEEEKGYRRSVRKPNRNTTTSYKRSSRQKKTAPKKRSEQRKRAKENLERRKRQGKRSAPERKRGDSRKRNLVDEEFERVQESEYNNYGFD